MVKFLVTMVIFHKKDLIFFYMKIRFKQNVILIKGGLNNVVF